VTGAPANGTLYVSDLDGTLLRPDGTLGERTIEVINARIAGGALFTIATARSYHSARRVTGALRLRLPVITYGGAAVIDPVTGTWRTVSTMPRASIRTLLAAFAARNLQPVLYVLRDGVDRFCWLDRDVSAEVAEFVGPPPRSPRAMPVRSWDDVDLTAVFYITVIGRERDLTGLAPVPGCRAVLSHDAGDPGRRYLEFTAGHATKGHGVAGLKRELGASRVVVFGDDYSDLSMFAVADESYATANAAEPVRTNATAVIGGNADQAVAEWLVARAAAAG
jgi:Cof subfamily protein (haloacid dehalogenase superfamily)